MNKAEVVSVLNQAPRHEVSARWACCAASLPSHLTQGDKAPYTWMEERLWPTAVMVSVLALPRIKSRFRGRLRRSLLTILTELRELT